MKNLIIAFLFLLLAVGGFIMLQQKPSVIVLLGAPGSGKGTQAVQLSKTLSLPHISTGDLFRENVRKSTPLGKKAKEYMDAGKLVPDKLVLDMLFDRVKEKDCAKGYLLDGFPRTIPQAQALTALLEDSVELIALNIAVDDSVVIDRITGRLSCPSCGSVFHAHFAPPQKSRLCDKCQTPLIQRSDDSVSVVTERLHSYHAQTEPLIGFFEAKGVLSTVDGTKKPDQVTEELLFILNGK